MIHYLFKMAQAYCLPFAVERGQFRDDAAALDHVRKLAASYPGAATITVTVEPRTVGRVPVNGPGPDEYTSKAVLDSRARIAASRELLKAMEEQAAS